MRALAGILLLAARVHAAPMAVSIRSTDHAFFVAGRFDVAASTAVASGVITDYDGIPRFVSAIRTSRVVRRQGASLLVEQEGRARFLFFSHPVRLLLEIREEPGRVEFRDVGSPELKLYQGSWTLSPDDRGCVVAYELTAEPIAGLAPKFATKRTLKANARRLLREVRAEILRRARTR